MEDSYGQPLDPHHMGAIYSRIKPTVGAEKPAGEWQTFDIALVDRHVTVVLNGKKILDGRDSKHSSGVIGLQYNVGGGKIEFRNIKVRPIKH